MLHDFEIVDLVECLRCLRIARLKFSQHDLEDFQAELRDAAHGVLQRPHDRIVDELELCGVQCQERCKKIVSTIELD